MHARFNHILLIEDAPGITETPRRVLADEGHEVATEMRGCAGLARATAGTFNSLSPA